MLEAAAALGSGVLVPHHHCHSKFVLDLNNNITTNLQLPLIIIIIYYNNIIIIIIINLKTFIQYRQVVRRCPFSRLTECRQTVYDPIAAIVPTTTIFFHHHHQSIPLPLLLELNHHHIHHHHLTNYNSQFYLPLVEVTPTLPTNNMTHFIHLVNPQPSKHTMPPHQCGQNFEKVPANQVPIIIIIIINIGLFLRPILDQRLPVWMERHRHHYYYLLLPVI